MGQGWALELKNRKQGGRWGAPRARVGTSQALAELGCLGGTLSTAKEFCLLALGGLGGGSQVQGPEPGGGRGASRQPRSSCRGVSLPRPSRSPGSPAHPYPSLPASQPGHTRPEAQGRGTTPLWLGTDTSTPGDLAATASLADPWELLTSLRPFQEDAWPGGAVGALACPPKWA